MIRFILLSLLQCTALSAGQVFMKISLMKTGPFRFSLDYAKAFLTCWEWAACGASFTVALFTWTHILRKYEFSLAYPVTSFTFVLSLLAAYFVFHETIPINRWIGVGFIVLGVVFVVSK